MKKEGEWIASLSSKLEVAQVDVEANEVLDLVEVTEIDRVTGRPTSVRFFDRVECTRLRDQLDAAISALHSDRYAAAEKRAIAKAEQLNAGINPKRPPDSGA